MKTARPHHFLSLAREKSAHGPSRLLTLPDHLQAVQTLVTGLKPCRNWYLDLANERNVRDSRFVSCEDLGKSRDRTRELDPNRLITASHSSDDFATFHARQFRTNAPPTKHR